MNWLKRENSQLLAVRMLYHEDVENAVELILLRRDELNWLLSAVRLLRERPLQP
jgi:hypothetical protein